ncbi:histidine phosphatase [Saccharata proteae CBS 121410]|uniref:Histidine phosphatase n=1 Tax=Saccharata proteae CBS 121410 TaxID=1314787 RepID=A0A6A5YCQ7_9PEZI|nr:histidine phosphatase [Saccharata proteae CBS 121410]
MRVSKGNLSALATLFAAGVAEGHANGSTILTDVDAISRYWGQMATYRDNPAAIFGVKDAGLPDGCQIEQVHVMQRHANRFPIDYVDDGDNDLAFAYKIGNWTANSSGFSGPLEFLNSYRYIMPETGLLTGLGAGVEMNAGIQFWNRYGRTLYNASLGQLTYSPTLSNGSERAKPLLRTTSQSRMYNSMLNWALGFFGPSFEATPNPTLANFTDAFHLLVIPEGGSENNTLASYDSCTNDYVSGIGDLGDSDVFKYVPIYLSAATARLQKYAPSGFTLTTNDTYAMQSICAYETQYISQSDFCALFTADEWAGFENTLDMIYYYDYAWGNPTGRAQGIGYVQELLARLQNQYITTSNSSVNSSLTDNAGDFPLGLPFYADFSHDDIIISVLAAMSIDYFRQKPSLTDYPPNPNRHFNLARLTPFGARLTTEVIGCGDSDPKPVHQHRTFYYPEQYGYDASNAPHKFVRMRLNDGIVPLDSIRGGACERSDGLCALEAFVESQRESYERSAYDYACFGNYSVVNNGTDFDGAVR